MFLSLYCLSRPWQGGGGGGGWVPRRPSPVGIVKLLMSVFINACRLLSALLSLSQFGRGRLSLVMISFYALSLLFGPYRLSEFTLAGPLCCCLLCKTSTWFKNRIIVSLTKNFYFCTSLFYTSLYCCWKLIKNDGQTTNPQSMDKPQGYATHMDQPEMDYTCWSVAISFRKQSDSDSI